MLLIALNDSKKDDNQEIRNGILKEVKELQNQQQKKLQRDIQILSKKADSVLQGNYKSYEP
mgnify:CR=1 FL=1